MNINDRELLARTLQAEAGNQGFGGMLAAGSVIMNRANSSGYGNGVRGVILKPGQFSAWNSVTGYAGGEQGQDMQGMTPSADAYRAADQLIAGDYSDPTAGATHYFNPDISQPSWAKGKRFHRIGDHVFGRADGKPVDPDQAIADQTMTAIGKGPRGILAAPEPEAQPMIANQQRQGLLGSLGVQKMQPGAEGETGQRFYERDTFKDTAARMAQGFAALGGNPAVQKFAADVAAQRTESKARNKTVDYLRKAGRPDIADMVAQGLISGRDAAGAIMQQPKDERTSLMKNYEFYIGKGMSPEEAMQAVKSGTSVTIGQKGADQFDKLDSTALSEVSQAGMTAARSLTQIDRLEALLSNVDTGVAASIKDLAGNFGINTEGLDDIQAAKALINNLVPQQRAPGSGPMSDKDLEIFKQSLPRLINQPGGNEIILQTMRGIAQYDAAGFDIVQKYRSGEIDKQQAFAELRNRPDPFAGIRLGVGAPVDMGRERALELLTGEGN